MTIQVSHGCWCGGELNQAIGAHYRRCKDCGAAVLSVLPGRRHFDVVDDKRDFYGRNYWTRYQTERSFPDISQRARSDLFERCLFWLERLLEVARPPGRVLEIGCGHGGFVRLLQELGFDAVGTELSPWVIEFARRTFGVRMLRGSLETLNLDPGFLCVAAFDVIEHLDDPLDMVRRCADLLDRDGVLLLQTPCYRGEGPDWAMFQEEEHIHLFTEESIRLLLARAGFKEMLVRPSLFPHDMWVVATRGRLTVRASGDDSMVGDPQFPAAFRALVALWRQVREVRETLAVVDADRAARLEDVNQLTALLRESEADRAARLEDVNQLTALLRESEADRAARLEDVNQLTALLRESEAERAARLEVIRSLQAELERIKQTWVWRLCSAMRFLGGPGTRVE